MAEMGELRVGELMVRTPVAVRRETMFKDVACALLTTDACAVPVVDAAGRPVGTVAGSALLSHLEFHGGSDPRPLLGGTAARARWRLSGALTAAELMLAPPTTVYDDTPVRHAITRLAQSPQPLLCVVDADMRLIGVLTPRELLTVYQRTDTSIEAEIRARLTPDLERPAGPPAAVNVLVHHGIVTLNGTVQFRSRAEHAAYTVAHVPGVVTVHNNLIYDIDDLAITGF